MQMTQILAAMVNPKGEFSEKLEDDSKIILQFMVSNGLVANESKTVFMMINNKKSSAKALRKK